MLIQLFKRLFVKFVEAVQYYNPNGTITF